MQSAKNLFLTNLNTGTSS